MNEETTTAETEGFQPITSQEQFNKAIGGRIAAVKEQFADYDTWRTKAQELESVNAALAQRAEQAESKAAEFETERQRSQWASDVAKISGVPAEALRGNTREELESHAATLKALMTPPPKNRTSVPPGRSDQGDGGSRAAAALRALRAQAG